jgi:hypothetical protein
MEAFGAETFVNDELLRYISQRSGKLYQLRFNFSFFVVKNDGWTHRL